MKLAVKSENILEQIAVSSGALPQPLIMLFWGWGVSKTLMTAVKLNVFEELNKNEMSGEEFARKSEISIRGCKALFNALCGFGYLKKKQGRYSLTAVSKRFMLEESKFSMADAFRFFSMLVEAKSDVEKQIRMDETYDLHKMDLSQDFWKYYMRTLAMFAEIPGKEIASKNYGLRDPKRLLDIGGGHGVYADMFVKKYKNLSAEVLDLKEACEEGRTIQQKRKGNVKFTEGDLRKLNTDSKYDIILLFNVLHNLNDMDSKKAVSKCAEALNENGALIILDSENDDSKEKYTFTSGYNELFFFLISSAGAHPERDMKDWMSEAGLKRVRKERLLTVPNMVLISGRKTS